MNRDTIQIEVPTSALIAALLADRGVRVGAERPRVSLSSLPDIGAPLHDGIYAGLTLHNNTPHALVLLPGDEEKPWKEALAWAEQQGGMLPSRMDALALWQNLPKQFKKEWYWTSDEYAGNADYAWVQGFSYGGSQYCSHKSIGCRCRAVRRIAI